MLLLTRRGVMLLVRREDDAGGKWMAWVMRTRGDGQDGGTTKLLKQLDLMGALPREFPHQPQTTQLTSSGNAA
jgi:hypothetical protein